MKNWQTSVYRTDLTEGEKFMGFFFDEAQANHWIAARTEGAYVTKPPKAKPPKPKEGSS